MTLPSHRDAPHHAVFRGVRHPILGLIVACAFLGDATRHGGAQEDPVPRPSAPAKRNFLAPLAPAADPRKDAADKDGPTLFVTDRQTSLLLDSAQRLIAAKDYAQAIQQLQHVLDNSEDFAYASDATPVVDFRSAKQHAARLITKLPQEGLEVYEREYGATARRMLRDGIANGDTSAPREVARRYFHTQAGAEASYMLGTRFLDQSDSLTARYHLEKLLAVPRLARSWQPMLSLKLAVCAARLGDAAKAAEILKQLKTTQPNASVTIGGKSVPLFDKPEQALEWLNSVAVMTQGVVRRTVDEWPLFRGDPARNPDAGGVPIGQPRWSVSTVRNTYDIPPKGADELADAIREYEKKLRADDALTLPSTHPLIVKDTVIYRTLKDVRAVSLETGELRWVSAAADPHFVHIFERGRGIQVDLGLRDQSPRNHVMHERLWRDFTWGTLSSDGTCVYAVEDLGFWGIDTSLRGSQLRSTARDQNRLIAYDLSTGKIRWELGGPRQERPSALAGTFFLGAPLPIEDTLYCLGEIEGEIRLWAVDPETGNVRWMQRLIFPDSKFSHAMHRRIGGTSPSYLGGLLLCPTSSGALIAVDPMSREIAWTFLYSTDFLDESFSVPLRELNNQPDELLKIDDQSRWIDSSPTVAEGRVLLSPRDSVAGELFCLELADGSLKWKRNRGTGLYVAAVQEGKVIIVGRDQVEAWNLSNGRDAWPKPTSIPLPGGRGILNGESYVLPLSTGEIATIDLKSGSILGRSMLANGQSAGNLTAARDAIVIQTVDSVQRFNSFEAVRAQIARDLEKNPDDPVALARRGEVRLHLGETDAGLADLRRSNTLQPDPRTSALLIERLMEGLRTDFVKNRGNAAEIESLIRLPKQRLEFYTLLAAGVEDAGDRLAAFQTYLKLSRQHDTLRERTPLSNTLTTRGDQWLAPKISALFQAADPGQKSAFDELASARLKELIAANEPLELYRFAKMFDALPAGARARQAFIDRLDPQTQAALIELQLNTLRRNSSPEVAGWAVARLARLLIDRKLVEHAIPLLDELDRDWKEKSCLDGKTGAQLAAEWRSQPDVKSALERSAPWPDRYLKAVRTAKTGKILSMSPIRILGRRGPSLAGWTFNIERVHPNESRINAHDDRGALRWSLPIDPEIFGEDGSLDSLTHVHIQGHFLLLAIRNHLVALDTLSDPRMPRILWSRLLFEVGTPINQIRSQLPNSQSGLVTNQFVCYQNQTTLHILDVVTGELLWERRGIGPATHVFGDEEFLFIGILHKEDDDVLVVRATDGTDLETRLLQRTSYGGRQRYYLNWDNQQTTGRLALTDAHTGRDLWQHEFSQPGLSAPVGEDEIAVVEGTGKFTILSISDGSVRVEQPMKRTSAFAVFRTPDRYVLCTYSPTNPRIYPTERPTRPTMLLVAGAAYGFDRATGKQVWQTDLPFAWVDTTQSPAVPILVLRTSPVTEQRPSRRSTFGLFGVSLLDMRNGKIFYESNQRERDYPFELHLDTENQKIEVQTAGSSIEVTLTDTPHTAPPPPESLPQPEPARDPVRAAKPGEPMNDGQ